MRTSLLFLFVLLVHCFTALAQKADFRHCQSPVRNLPLSAQPAAIPVCDLMETFSGIPNPLSPLSLIPDEEHEKQGSVSSYMAFVLTTKGLTTELDTSKGSFVHYRCPENTVLAVTDRSKINDCRKLTKLLDQGLRGIVVSYDWSPRDWRHGDKRLMVTQSKAKKSRSTHSVLIVGYEDSTFIFKNSWGKGWGASGYGRMSFAYHRTHAKEGLFAYLSETTEPATHQVAAVGLRLQSEVLEGKAQIQASVFADGPGRLPTFHELKYNIRRSDQRAVFPKSVILMDAARPTGYPALFDLPEPDAAYVLELQYRVSENEDWIYLQAPEMRWGDPVISVFHPEH